MSVFELRMIKKITGVSAIVVSFALTFMGCRNTPIIPQSPAISFNNDIQPIIAGNCQMSGCHGNNNGGEERAKPLLTYDDVISHGGIAPYNAHNSDLYERVINATFYNVMPPSQYNRLSQQQLLKIYLWIEQGASNN